MQGDGSLYTCKIKGKKSGLIVLMLEAMDYEMVEKTRDLMQKYFDRRVVIYRKATGAYGIRYCVKGLLEKFKELEIDFSDPPKPPRWISLEPKFFGAYIAGLIDSDGNVCIKRPRYPMCQIRIISGSPQTELQKAVEANLHCETDMVTVTDFNKTWKIWTTRTNLVFLVSRKNLEIIKNFVLPHITIYRKRSKIEQFIKNKSIKRARRVELLYPDFC